MSVILVLNFIHIDELVKLVKKSIIYEFDLVVLDNYNGVFERVENELEFLFLLQIFNNALHFYAVHLIQDIKMDCAPQYPYGSYPGHMLILTKEVRITINETKYCYG